MYVTDEESLASASANETPENDVETHLDGDCPSTPSADGLPLLRRSTRPKTPAKTPLRISGFKNSMPIHKPRMCTATRTAVDQAREDVDDVLADRFIRSTLLLTVVSLI